MQCSSLHEKIEVKSTDGDYISASEIWANRKEDESCLVTSLFIACGSTVTVVEYTDRLHVNEQFCKRENVTFYCNN